MSTNPYSTPLNTGNSPFQTGGVQPTDSFVKQIPIIGIFMIVEGGLEILFGGFYIAISLLAPDFIAKQPMPQNPNMPAQDLEQMSQFLFWIYFGMGVPSIFAGLVRTIGGIQVLRCKSHIFGIIANFVGLLSCSTCYCLPTSIGCSVYSLIVLFQPTVKAEFERRKT